MVQNSETALLRRQAVGDPRSLMPKTIKTLLLKSIQSLNCRVLFRKTGVNEKIKGQAPTEIVQDCLDRIATFLT